PRSYGGVKERSKNRRLPVCPEDRPERLNDLTLGGASANAVDDRRHQVVGAARDLLERVETGGDAGVVATLAQLLETRRLLHLDVGIDDERGWRGHIDAVREHVDANNDPFSGLELALVSERRVGDLTLREALGDGGEHAATLGDRGEVVLRGLLHAVGEILDEPRAGEGIDDRGDAGLVGEDLLGAERD